MKISTYVVCCLALGGLAACYPSKPRNAFEAYSIPAPPDYGLSECWAALPSKRDSADVLPSTDLTDGQSEARGDVFYIHPTTYTGKWGQNQWNAPVDDARLNEATDAIAVRNQASIFNACFKVYAPRYRQAHYQSYFTERHKQDAEMAFQMAYEDVKNAFQYYLQNDNHGRPILIAGHSQGAMHAARLLKEFFDGTPLERQLVGCYIPGMPIYHSQFESLELCKDSADVHCINTWRTMKWGHHPKYQHRIDNDDVMCINPVSWTRDTVTTTKADQLGMVLPDFYTGYHEHLSSTRISDGVVWIEKPKFRGSFLYLSPNFHSGDFNLFYMNVRQNACQRLEAFLHQK